MIDPRRAAILALLSAATPALAYDINDQFSIGALLAATGQCQNVSARLPGETYGEVIDDTVSPPLLDTTMDRTSDECRGGMPIQFELDFHPTERDQFFAKLGWGVDNALNEVSPWRLAPWAADLEADVEDINGSGRDYLLTAWYRHRFDFGEGRSLAPTIGILDSTDYLDGNEYANDEYTQFMNEAFVNAGNYNLPSYAAGAALEAAIDAFSFNAVGLNIPENDDGKNYNFWGVEAGWHPEFKLGAGNYRLLLTGTSSAFAPPTPEDDGTIVATPDDESLLSYGLSFDQAIGETLGLFLRLTWQDENALVDYAALYSGGINLAGGAWRRPDDNIGLGYAYLEGGNSDIQETNVFEAYYRATLNEYFALTADVQYMDDDLNDPVPTQEDPSGWVFGLRAVAAF